MDWLINRTGSGRDRTEPQVDEDHFPFRDEQSQSLKGNLLGFQGFGYKDDF